MIYALYKGDEFLVVGTIEECAEYINSTPNRIRWLATPTNHKQDKGDRLIAIRVDEKE